MSMLDRFLLKGGDHGGKVKQASSSSLISQERRGLRRNTSSRRGWFRGGGDKRNIDDEEDEEATGLIQQSRASEKQKRKPRQQKLEQRYAALEEECTKLKFQQTQLVALQDQRKLEGNKVQNLMKDLEVEQKDALNENDSLRSQVKDAERQRQRLDQSPLQISSFRAELRNAEEALQRRKADLRDLQRQKEEAMAKGAHLVQWIQELRQSVTISDEVLAKKKRIEDLKDRLHLLKEDRVTA